MEDSTITSPEDGEISAKDFEYSEFKAPPAEFKFYILVGLLMIGVAVAVWLFMKDERTVLMILTGIGLIAYGIYVRGNRLLFKDWVIYRYRGRKELWKLPIADIQEITRLTPKGDDEHVLLKSASGEERRVAYADFISESDDPAEFARGGSRKLRLMLTDPKRARAAAHEGD